LPGRDPEAVGMEAPDKPSLYDRLGGVYNITL